MRERCEAEVIGLHRFLEEWFTGALPRTEEAMDRIKSVIAEGFAIISPRGVATGREEMMAELERAHGGLAGADKGFRIWVDDIHFRHDLGDTALVTYAEHQELAGETTGRRASALFRRKIEAPNGVEWVHLHETWLPSLAPKA